MATRYSDEWRQNVSASVKRWHESGKGGMSDSKKKEISCKLSEANRRRFAKVRSELLTRPFDELSIANKRQRVLIEASYSCEKCKWHEARADGKIPTQVNHKNGVHSDWRRENLEALCPNCHSLTDKFMFYGGAHSDETKQRISVSLKTRK